MADQRRRLVVDAMNVIGSRPTGWWRDRRGAMTRLVEELGRYAEATDEDVTVVLDSDPFAVGAPGPLRTKHGPPAIWNRSAESVRRSPLAVNVTKFEAAEAALVPIAFVAVTVKV